MKYLVNTPNDGSEGLIAETWAIRDGALTFYNKHGDLVIAYAPGAWTTFFPEESA